MKTFFLIITTTVVLLSFPCSHEEPCQTLREHRDKDRLKPTNGLSINKTSDSAICQEH